MAPRGLADGLEHDVDALGEPAARLEGLIRPELARLLALLLAARGGPDACAGRGGQGDGRGADAAAGALNEDRAAGRNVAASEQHPVGGEPGRGKARRLFEAEL